MGASKRLMEDLILSNLNIDAKTARFGNVAFSKGSLLNSFDQRINSKQPIPVPKNVFRYFLTEKEAAFICILASICKIEKPILIPKSNLITPVSIEEIIKLYLGTKNLKYKIYKSDKFYKSNKESSNTETVSLIYDELNTTGEKSTELFFEDSEEIINTTFKSLECVVYKDLSINFGEFIEEFNLLVKSSRADKQLLIDLLKKHLKTFSHNSSDLSLNDKR